MSTTQEDIEQPGAARPEALIQTVNDAMSQAARLLISDDSNTDLGQISIIATRFKDLQFMRYGAETVQDIFKKFPALTRFDLSIQADSEIGDEGQHYMNHRVTIDNFDVDENVEGHEDLEDDDYVISDFIQDCGATDLYMALNPTSYEDCMDEVNLSIWRLEVESLAGDVGALCARMNPKKWGEVAQQFGLDDYGVLKQTRHPKEC